MSFIGLRTCSEEDFANLATKDNGTLYRVQKTGGTEDVYMGDKKLNGSGGSGVLVEDGVVKFDYSKI